MCSKAVLPFCLDLFRKFKLAQGNPNSAEPKNPDPPNAGFKIRRIRMTIRTIAAHHENLSLAISAFAFLVSGFSLGWNIYRDVILRARVRVSFELSQFLYASGPKDKHRLWLSAMNIGPGEVIIEMAVVRTQSALLAWFKKEESAKLMIHEHECEIDSKLPAKMPVAKKIFLSFPVGEKCILDQNPLRIGVRDSFGRNHWASVKDLKKAHRKYSEYKASLK